MPCSHIRFPDGTVAILKHAKTRFPLCKFCGNCEATLLCDFIVATTHGGAPMTCDRPICVHCARSVGEKDFCPRHAG
jgi:hypothetical protein